MSKVILIIVGVIIAVMGILTLFPAMTLGLWLTIVLIGVGIISIILGFLDKRKTVIKEVAKEVKQEEQEGDKIE
jgi:cytosine/uracil/thiamine/allantoin permease